MTSTGMRNAHRIAARQMRDTRRRLGLELRTLREDAGLSLRAVARAAGVDHAHLLRVERGDVNANAETLAAIAAVLGADLSMRLLPQTGPLVRDHIQARITDALLEVLDRRWERHLEVLVRRPSRGVIDVVLRDAAAGVLVAVEVQSDLRRLEQQIRWLHEKAAGLIGVRPLSAARDRALPDRTPPRSALVAGHARDRQELRSDPSHGLPGSFHGDPREPHRQRTVAGRWDRMGQRRWDAHEAARGPAAWGAARTLDPQSSAGGPPTVTPGHQVRP